MGNDEKELVERLRQVAGRDDYLRMLRSNRPNSLEAANSIGQFITDAIAATADAASTIERLEQERDALREALNSLRGAGNIAYNLKQTATYTSDRDNYRRISEAIDGALAALLHEGQG